MPRLETHCSAWNPVTSSGVWAQRGTAAALAPAGPVRSSGKGSGSLSSAVLSARIGFTWLAIFGQLTSIWASLNTRLPSCGSTIRHLKMFQKLRTQCDTSHLSEGPTYSGRSFYFGPTCSCCLFSSALLPGVGPRSRGHNTNATQPHLPTSSKIFQYLPISSTITRQEQGHECTWRFVACPCHAESRPLRGPPSIEVNALA